MSVEIRDKRVIPFTLIDNPVLENEELSGTAKLVYTLLCKFANSDTGQCYPSHQTLAKLAGVSKPTVMKALSQLEETQHISITRRTEGKQRLTNIYTILGVGGSKASLPPPVKPVYKGSKAALPGVVKPVYQGSKASLHELYPSNQINKNQIHLTIFDHWNGKGIIQHRKLTQKTISKINSKLKDYTPEEIMQAIDNYARILDNPDKYYFTYRWQLWEFLDRGLEKMLDWEIADNNYRKDKPKKSGVDSGYMMERLAKAKILDEMEG